MWVQSGGYEWGAIMKNVRGAVLVMVLFLGSPMVALGSGNDISTGWIHREGNASLKSLLHKEVSQAKKVGKTIVVMFTADWCAPCKALKDMMHGSPLIGKLAKKGRVVFVDVDEWRGPAHRLFPGVNPQKLPTLVSLDPRGTQLSVVRGTDLGLLSAEDTGQNLKRLIAGAPLRKPSYSSDSTKRTELIRASALKGRKLTENWKPLRVEVVGKKPKKGQWGQVVANISIRNKDSRRRWYVIGVPGQPLAEMPQIESWSILRFNEHVRAYYLAYVGYPNFAVIPVAGGGGVDLNGWPLRVGPRADSLEIWELNKFSVDGAKKQFDKKVPYLLEIQNAANTAQFHSEEGQPQVDLKAATKHLMPLF